MDHALANLIAASIAFVGTHFALSHPLRAPLVARLGAAGFQGLYSLVAFATLGWMIFAFRAVGPGGAPLWNGSGDAVWIIASLLTLVASVLLVGSLIGNPALPIPTAAAKAAAAKGPHGVFHSTRHPMMWAFALWAVAHILVSPTPRNLVLCGAVAFLALVGSHLQDRKKAAAMGADWHEWHARTNFGPRLGRLAWAGWVPWVGGLALWLAASWAHLPLNGMVAGVWRWL